MGKTTMSVQELSAQMGISLPKAYELVKTPGFPTIRIGARILIPIEAYKELYIGKWSQEIQDEFVFNNFIDGTKVPHEGIVVKHTSGERNKIAKAINPDYLIYGEKHDIGDSHYRDW